ncbi:MAG: hypothetical protein HPZ91_02250 [Lentisphaeria bacterium]|nr:hypothetical protein [Lentisphaeria bacterium]
MDWLQCMLLCLGGGRGEGREMVFSVSGDEPFRWSAAKPVTVYGFPADLYYESEDPPLLRFRVDAEGGWLEACDSGTGDRALDRVRLFAPGGGWRFRTFRFVWAADGRRVRFEVNGVVEAVADLAAKRLAVRGGDSGRPLHAHWSKEGHEWDESLLEAFDRVPEKPLGRPFWRPVRKLSGAMRLYLLATTYFGLITFWLAVGLAGARYITFEQALFGWIALRCANRILQCFADPWRIRAEAAIPDLKEPDEKTREAYLKYRNRAVTGYLVYILLAVFGLCGFVPGWIPWAAMVAVCCSGYVPTLLNVLGIQTPEVRRCEKLMRMSGYQLEVREKLLRSHVPKLPFFIWVMKKYFAGGTVAVGISEPFGKSGEYDDAAEIVTGPLRELAAEAGVTVLFVPDGLTPEKLDASFAGAEGAEAFFSFSAGWKAWTGTELWRRPPESRPAVFATEITAMEFKEAFAAIRDGRLLGAGIGALKLKQLDLASLLPDELRLPESGEGRAEKGEIANLLPVDRDNLDAVIELLVKGGLETFRPLLREGADI